METIIIHKDAGLADPLAKVYRGGVSRDQLVSINERRYTLGFYPPNYPVPALRTDMLYWRMPAYPTHELIAQWYLWRQGAPHRYRD